MYPFSLTEINDLTAALDGTDEFVFLETSRLTREDHRSFLFRSPLRWLACEADDDPRRYLEQLDEARSRGLFCAGWFTYEFGYLLEPSLAALSPAKPLTGPLALFGLFEKPVVYDHEQGTIPGGDPLLFAGRENLEACTVANLQPGISRREYLDAVARIKEYIAAGDTYQVNFTLKLQGEISGSPAAIYRMLRRNQSVSYSAWIRHNGRDIMSFSPELFFRFDQGRLRVRPMKGTGRRGLNVAEDDLLRRQLSGDVKNRSENVMIVDLLRNDLGRLLYETGGGRVKPQSLFDVETYETLFQMTSTVDAVPLRGGGFSLRQILSALFPCGSITGAPKIRTMEIIEECEKDARGIYCGAIGFAGPEETVFNVPIRTVEITGGQCVMGIGSGIVHDSDPGEEWEECLLKGRFLTDPQPDFQLFETLLWQQGGKGYLLLEKHLDRLFSSARYFLFPCDHEVIRKSLTDAAEAFTGNTRVRLLVCRDGRVSVESAGMDGERGPDFQVPISKKPLPQAVISEKKTDPADHFLYHKTTMRNLYDRERSTALSQGFYEVLFVNLRGEITEGSITNVFVDIDGELITPPLMCGLLAGTLRQLLLEQNRVREQVLSPADLQSARAVYVGNSVRGLVQVRLH